MEAQKETKCHATDMQRIKGDMYERIIKVALPQVQCQLHNHAKSI